MSSVALSKRSSNESLGISPPRAKEATPFIIRVLWSTGAGIGDVPDQPATHRSPGARQERIARPYLANVSGCDQRTTG